MNSVSDIFFSFYFQYWSFQTREQKIRVSIVPHRAATHIYLDIFRRFFFIKNYLNIVQTTVTRYAISRAMCGFLLFSSSDFNNAYYLVRGF